ncbi:MAG: GNAT family N-acetyltransferase, partial [Actinomycetota bacterium]
MDPTSPPSGYPAHRAIDIGLRDGSTVHIRPILPSDLDDVDDLFTRVSFQSLRLRFHGVHHPSRDELRRFVEIDYRDSFSLVAVTALGDGPRIVALATYIGTTEKKAELALLVDDPFHGRGIGSILIEHLSEAAAEAGIETLEAEILSANSEMLEVLRSLELPVDSKVSFGAVHAEFPTSPTPAALEAFERREAVASAAGVRAFLKPSSVAVIGASRKRGTISGEIFHNLLDAGFEGPVFPVNPHTPVVQSVSAYASVTEVPGPVDLAVIAVPARSVLSAATECAEKGIRALLVITSGFAEIGAEGAELQRALLEIARRHGMRIVGPNCMGLMNTDPSIRLDASFAPSRPSSGRLAFSSQSGALGIAVIDRSRELGLGLSSFVSV